MPSTISQRREYLAALRARVGDSLADEAATIVDFVAADLGWSETLLEQVLTDLVKGGLVTAPTKTGAIGFTAFGLGAARNPGIGDVDDEDD